MFKLSVITDEISQDLETVVKFANEFGLDGVEIRRVWDKSPQDLLEDVNLINKTIKENNLKISCIASPFFKSNIDNLLEYDEHLNILRKCIEFAESLNCSIIRGFTFWRVGSIRERLDEIIGKFQKPLEIIDDSNVILGIENEPSTHAGNGTELRIFLDELNSKKVKVIWDPGNDVWDQSGEVPYPNGYDQIKNDIVHVHLKDGFRGGTQGDHRYSAFGEGEIDYIGQFKALKKDGYTGYLSMETHWRIGDVSDVSSVKLDDVSFSSQGERSSRICINNLLTLLKRLEN
jgi:sugar phosphate isomerase/epimerase